MRSGIAILPTRQGRRVAQTTDLLGAMSQADGDLGGEHADAFGVLGGLVVAVGDRSGKQLQRPGASVIQLERGCFADRRPRGRGRRSRVHSDGVPSRVRKDAPRGVLVDKCTSG